MLSLVNFGTFTVFFLNPEIYIKYLKKKKTNIWLHLYGDISSLRVNQGKFQDGIDWQVLA